MNAGPPDVTAFALTAEQQEIADAARVFGEKWASRASEIDRLDMAPTDEMIKDTVALAVEQACRSMKS
jgi:hypothetical protein